MGISSKLIKGSSFVKRIMGNKKARERYHIKRYGNLDRLEEKERKWNQKYDDENSKNEWNNPTNEDDFDL